MRRLLLLKTLALSVALAALAACGSHGNGGAAPIDDNDTLQQLSKAYTALAAEFSRPPQDMTPGERKAFVEQVFKNAGYSYNATLHEIATRRLDFTKQSVIDMAQLLTFPQRGERSLQDAKQIYTPAQYRDMEILEKRLNG
mgnify:CR=1 FL=1